MKEYVDIDGHKNGLFIESTDFKNPVFLFLHGGPGFLQYSWKERLNIPKGSFFSYDALGETLSKVDAALMAPRFEVPVFIIHGSYDYQTSYKEAMRFYEKIEAPLKRIYTFENSAHSPFLEDKERFVQILKNDVLGIK